MFLKQQITLIYQKPCGQGFYFQDTLLPAVVGMTDGKVMWNK